MHANSHCVYSAIKDKALFSPLSLMGSAVMSSASHLSSNRGITITHTLTTPFSHYFFFVTKHVSSKEAADTITMPSLQQQIVQL